MDIYVPAETWIVSVTVVVIGVGGNGGDEDGFVLWEAKEKQRGGEEREKK